MTGAALCQELQTRADAVRKQAGEEREHEQKLKKLAELGAQTGGFGGHHDCYPPQMYMPKPVLRSDALMRQAEEIDTLIRHIDQKRVFDLNFAELTGLGVIRFGLGTAFAGSLVGADL